MDAVQSPAPDPSPGVRDPFEVRALYRRLRVTDVCDALDGIG